MEKRAEHAGRDTQGVLNQMSFFSEYVAALLLQQVENNIRELIYSKIYLKITVAIKFQNLTAEQIIFHSKKDNAYAEHDKDF